MLRFAAVELWSVPFRRLEERFSVVENCKSNDPAFVSQAAMLRCALQNFTECKDTGYLTCYANYSPTLLVAMETSLAVDIRNAIGDQIHNLVNVHSSTSKDLKHFPSTALHLFNQ